MLGIYLLATILGGGLLALSLFGADHGGTDHGLDHDVGGHDGLDHAAGEMLLGLLKPRNIVFGLTGFGLTGLLLTLAGTSVVWTLPLAIAMGALGLVLSHVVFLWLRRSDTATEALDESEFEGIPARVVLPLLPGERGRVVCTIADREEYVTARLAADVTTPLSPGREVVILRVTDGVAEVSPLPLELPPATK